MECILWVQTLIYTLLQSLQWCMRYHVILDRIIKALDCTRYRHPMGWFNSFICDCCARHDAMSSWSPGAARQHLREFDTNNTHTIMFDPDHNMMPPFFPTATDILLIKSNLKFESRAIAVYVAMSPRYLGGKYRSRLHPWSRKCACQFLCCWIIIYYLYDIWFVVYFKQFWEKNILSAFMQISIISYKYCNLVNLIIEFNPEHIDTLETRIKHRVLLSPSSICSTYNWSLELDHSWLLKYYYWLKTKHFETQTKWPPFCRQHLWVHCLGRNVLNSNFTKFITKES